jgi:hypothetical protein
MVPLNERVLHTLITKDVITGVFGSFLFEVWVILFQKENNQDTV